MEPHDTAERLRDLDRLPVELVFDTADYPRPAGVRRRDESSRHLLGQPVLERPCRNLVQKPVIEAAQLAVDAVNEFAKILCRIGSPHFF